MLLTFEGQLTKQDVIKAQALHQRASRFPHAGRIAAVILLVLMSVGALAVDLALFQRVLPLVLLLLFFTFFQWWLPRLQAGATWRSYKALQAPVSGVVTPEGMQYNGADFKSELAWPVFIKYKRTDDMVLLYQGSNAFNIVPKSLFANDDQWAAFVQIVEQRVPQVIPNERTVNHVLRRVFVGLVLIVALLAFIAQLIASR
jgi:hypothetical protein